MTEENSEWIDKEDIKTEEEEEDLYPPNFKLNVSANDFNTATFFNFITEGNIDIAEFQRNFVWDIKRASKLIESIIIGIPIPQIFLYENEKDKFSVIDGQQRLLSIYYFISKRFPRDEKRIELRGIFDKHGKIPEEIFANNEYFIDFNLRLESNLYQSRLNGKNYSTLETNDKKTFDLRTIRSIIVRQIEPPNESAIYEIFYRLNTGGVNLTPQEIRMSLFDSPFLHMLSEINLNENWRKLTSEQPDLRMRDVEILLRGFAMLAKSEEYKKKSMIAFLNKFAQFSKDYKKEDITYLKQLFETFVDKASKLPAKPFNSALSNRFSISIYEAVFFAACNEAFKKRNLEVHDMDARKLQNLKNDGEFQQASTTGTTDIKNVQTRLRRASELLI